MAKKSSSAKTKKSTKKKSGAQKRVRGKGGRAKHAFMCFSKEKRKDVLAEVGLKDAPENFGAASKALSSAWAKLSEAQRKPFEASALIDRCRKEISELRGAKLKDAKGLDQLASTVKKGVQTLAHLSDTSLAAVLLEALESLDGRLGNAGRARLSETFRGGARAPEVLAACAQLRSAQLGGRLVALLRKWSSVPASQARPTPGHARRTQKEGPKEAPSVVMPRGDTALDDSMRSKFVGILMRTVSQTDKACFDACSKIERALFERCGKDPKEYRRRARSLSHNLGSSDGQLLRQVLSGELTAERLVALEGEDLAPEAVKEARKEERERYFRSEVHLKVAPPKRKRDLYKAAPAEEPPSTAPAAAPRNAAPDTAEDAELARALAEDSMSTSSSESDSSDSSSSGSSGEESLWETDFGLLPFATEAGGSQLAGEAQTASSSSSSSAMAPRAPRAPGSATVGGADGALVTLKGMGFDDLIATASLQAAGGNLEKAIVMLTS